MDEKQVSCFFPKVTFLCESFIYVNYASQGAVA